MNLPHLREQPSLDVVLLFKNSGMPCATAFSKGPVVREIVKEHGQRVTRSIAAKAADAYDAFRKDEEARGARELDPLHADPVEFDLVGKSEAPGWFFLKRLEKTRVPTRSKDRAGTIVRFARKALSMHATLTDADLATFYDEGDMDAGGPMAHIDALTETLSGVYGGDYEAMVEVTSKSIEQIRNPSRKDGDKEGSV